MIVARAAPPRGKKARSKSKLPRSEIGVAALAGDPSPIRTSPIGIEIGAGEQGARRTLERLEIGSENPLSASELSDSVRAQPPAAPIQPATLERSGWFARCFGCGTKKADVDVDRGRV